MVDAGHFAAAIPPTHRSAVKGFIEQALTHFHDLGFAHGIAGLEHGVDGGWSAMEHTEVIALRQRLESHLNRLSDEFRRSHRDVETKWKQADMHDPRKQQYFKDMNDKRRDLSKVLALDKTTFLLKILLLAQETYGLGCQRGLAIHAANERKQRLGLPIELIPIPVRMFVDPSDLETEDAGDPHASFEYQNKSRPTQGPGAFH